MVKPVNFRYTYSICLIISRLERLKSQTFDVDLLTVTVVGLNSSLKQQYVSSYNSRVFIIPGISKESRMHHWYPGMFQIMGTK